MANSETQPLVVSHRTPAPTVATAAQKEEICVLLNHPTFSRDDRTSVLRATFTMSFNDAQSTISVLTVAREAYDQGHEDPDGDGHPCALAA